MTRESITVRVDFYATIQKTFGEQSVRVTLSGARTVRALMESLATTPERRDRIFAAAGVFRQDMVVLKNGRNITFIGGWEAELENGDTVAMFPPTFGG